jgi:hypothetical protein
MGLLVWSIAMTAGEAVEFAKHVDEPYSRPFCMARENRIAQILHQRGVRDQNGNPWAWRLRCPDPPRYHCTKLSKAYCHVEKVLAETGQFP